MLNQPSFHGVVQHIGDNPTPFRFISHYMVIIFVLPKTSFTPQQQVGLAGSIAFERVHDGRHGMIGAVCFRQRGVDQVDVVRHDAKGIQVIDPPVTVMQALGHQVSDSGITEPEGAVLSRVQRCIPLAEKTALLQIGLLGAFLGIEDAGQDCFDPFGFCEQSLQYLGREGASQAESDKQCGAGWLDVRQVPTIEELVL